MDAFRQWFFSGLVALVACLAVPTGPTIAQPLTEEMIHRTSDTVRPGTKAYRFIRNFDHRYKCSTSTSSKKLQANKTLTRLEFVEIIQDCRDKILRNSGDIVKADAQAFDQAWGTRGLLAPFADDMWSIIVDGKLVAPPKGYGETRSSEDVSPGERYIFPGIDKLKAAAEKEADEDSPIGPDDPKTIVTEEGGNPVVVEPPLVVAEQPEIMLDTLGLSPIDTDLLVAEALSKIENQGISVTPDQIPLDLPHPACVRLPAAEQATCFRLAAIVDTYTSANGQLACLERCESKRAHYTFDQWLVAAGRRTVEREYAAHIGALGVATDETDRLGQEIDKLAAEIEETAHVRQVYIYENTKTGEIIQHFGNKFTPVAPLVYRGEALLPLNEVEQRRLAENRARLTALQAELSEKLADLAADDDLERWRNDALNDFWAQPPAGYLSCTRAEFDKEYEYCLSNCAGETIIGDSSCNIRGVSYRSRAFDRSARIALYPPGHPMRTKPYSP